MRSTSSKLLACVLLAVLAAPLVAQTDPTGPPVAANKKAEEELKSIDLGGGAAAPGEPGLPTLPEPRGDDGALSSDLVSSARSAKQLVSEHSPRSENSQYLFAAAIACGALGVLVLGWILGKRRR